MPGPDLVYGVWRGNCPADAKPWQSVCFAQTAYSYHSIIPTVERGRLFVCQTLCSSVHLIGQNPGSYTFRRSDYSIHFGLGENVAGGVVGIAYGDEPGVGCDCFVQFAQVECPAVLFSQMEFFHFQAVVLGNAPNLHVVGEHDDDLVSRRKQGAGGDVVGFGCPHGDQDVFHRGPIVQSGDVLP